MKILVISESFIAGGLERQIITQNQTLKKVEFIYAFCNYKENEFLKNNKVYKLNNDYTVKSFIKNVDTLVDIIKKEKIDYIHVHPFYTLFYALFAASLTKTPFCYTVHGFGSINFPYQINDIVLLKYFFNCLDNKVFCVSNFYKTILDNTYGRKNTIHIPNSIETKIYKECEYTNNGKWLLISRLDIDKSGEITLVINNMDKLGIKEIDIVGDGTEIENLKNLSKGKKIKFLGFKDNINEIVAKGYNGIIGVGQVVLEGLVSNIPTLLIGYGRITGLVDKEKYDNIKNYNFVNRYIEDDSLDVISKEISKLDKNINKYKLREYVINEFDSKIVFNNYYKQLSDKTYNNYDLEKVYETIKENVDNKLILPKENFFQNINIFYILKRYLKYNCNQNLLDSFDYCDLKVELELKTKKLNEDNIIHDTLKYENELLKSEIELLKQQLNEVNKKLNKIFDNKFIRILKKIKRKVKK